MRTITRVYPWFFYFTNRAVFLLSTIINKNTYTYATVRNLTRRITANVIQHQYFKQMITIAVLYINKKIFS